MKFFTDNNYESNPSTRPVLEIVSNHLEDVTSSILSIDWYVGAVKGARSISNHANKFTDPASDWVQRNSGYNKFIRERHTTNASAVAKHEVTFIPIQPQTENMLNQTEDFDPYAFDLMAEAQSSDDLSLAQTPITSPSAQEDELQTIIMSEQEKNLEQLRNVANAAAVSMDEANAYLAQVAQ